MRNTTAARLEEINATIAQLQAADGDMSAQIAALEKEAAQLEVKLAETNTKIDTVKSELTETISTEKANILAELEAFRATVNGELDAIKAVLETLKAKDVELDGKIATLQEYVDTELKATEDWATATFATLEQYNEVVATIATIEGNIEGLNESIAALETRINEKIAKDIEAAAQPSRQICRKLSKMLLRRTPQPSPPQRKRLPQPTPPSWRVQSPPSKPQ